MLFFNIDADRQSLSILYPEGKIQTVLMYVNYGVEPAYLVTFKTEQEERAAIAKASYNDNLDKALVKEKRN
jgi:hypothetical protein